MVGPSERCSASLTRLSTTISDFRVSGVTHTDHALLPEPQQFEPRGVVSLFCARLASQQALDLIRGDALAIEEERVQAFELLLPAVEGVFVLLLGLRVGHSSEFSSAARLVGCAREVRKTVKK